MLESAKHSETETTGFLYRNKREGDTHDWQKGSKGANKRPVLSRFGEFLIESISRVLVGVGGVSLSLSGSRPRLGLRGVGWESRLLVRSERSEREDLYESRMG